VTEGHPDKVADYISDAILDAYLEAAGEEDRRLVRVACETLCKSDRVILAGEITAAVEGDEEPVDHEEAVRQAVREIGYVDPREPFSADTLVVQELLTKQSREIDEGVNPDDGDQGAGDQGLMIGYATDETPELMPLPILLAHRLTRGLAEDRKTGRVDWLRPDGKAQVTVRYEDDVPVEVEHVVVSAQHAKGLDQADVHAYVREELAPGILGDWLTPATRYSVNPTGSFERGGPSVDCGLTGRKIIVDTYGGAVSHGGGAFSGKDPSKVDRSASYFCRWVARQVVSSGLARRCEVRVAYAIGEADPVSVEVDTFGTGDPEDVRAMLEQFDFRPAGIIDQLGLLEPLYRRTTNYGHFGRPGLPWEEDAALAFATEPTKERERRIGS
jgi:S-adenosylmethionine synthetase